MKTITLGTFLDAMEIVLPDSTEINNGFIRLHNINGDYIDISVYQVDNSGYDMELSPEELMNTNIDELIFSDVFGTNTYLYPNMDEFYQFIESQYKY